MAAAAVWSGVDVSVGVVSIFGVAAEVDVGVCVGVDGLPITVIVVKSMLIFN